MADLNMAGKILKGLNDFADNIQWGGKTILRGNEAINPIRTMGKFVMGEADTGIRGTLGAMSDGDKFIDAVKTAYSANKDGVIKGMGDINWKAAAGTYVGAAAAGRVLTGGGIYRDSTGNPNLPVLPFI